MRQSKDQGQGGGVTRSLNQRDRRPVVNTSSLHSAKTRAKTKQKKLTQKQTKIHRVTTDMCGITNSSTCFSLEAQRWDVQQFSLTSGRPSSGHQEKFHSTKTFRHFLPSWELHHSKTNHLIAEVPFPERYVWPRAVTSHHPGPSIPRKDFASGVGNGHLSLACGPSSCRSS